jgi:23S rRNA (cytosine1962-C5)-methyltransferase
MAESPGTPSQLVLRRHEDKRIRGGHAWVFSNEIDTVATPLGGVAPGAAVRLLDHRHQFLAHALVNPHALICARVVSVDEQQPFGPELLRSRVARALALRERFVGGVHYRLVYGDPDGLPGLVVDRYGEVLVAQTSTLAMDQRSGMIEAALLAIPGIRMMVWKNDGSARDLEALAHEVRAVGGDLPATVEVVEAGLAFQAPLANGQKTGWFYDQWANRAQLRQFMRPGARVLDVCSYVGGWAISSMAAGASTALCVDSSQVALDFASANATRNGVRVETRRGDAFDVLEALQAEGQQFDVLIVDPPAFIKRRKDIPKGEAAYRKLNQLALKVAADDALLVSCSCSWHLSAEVFPTLLQAAAVQANRELRVIAQGGQSPDHPVHPAMTETRYLKALFSRVCR